MTGELLVAGHDAAFDTRAVLSLAAVGRIGQYAAPDDRLTVGELIGERAVQDGISLSRVVDRAEEIEDFLGYRIDRGALYKDLPAAEKTMLCAGLAMLRPAAVVVVDEADRDVPAHQVATLFATLQRLATMENNVVIVSASNANAAPVGAMRVHLAPTKLSRVHKIEEPPVAIDEATEARMKSSRSTRTWRRRSWRRLARKERRNMVKPLRAAGLEFKHFRGIPVIALVFILVVPALYGGIYLHANWDLYNEIGKIKVAIVNGDKAAEYGEQTINAGSLLSQMQALIQEQVNAAVREAYFSTLFG